MAGCNDFLELGAFLAGALTKLEQAIDWAYRHAIEGIPGVFGAETLADEFLHSHPDREAIDALIQRQIINAGARREGRPES